jgi:hypothetical protein
MAQKIKPPPVKGEPKAATGDDDLKILYPHRIVFVTGIDGVVRELVVREYGFEESLLLRPLTSILLAALEELLLQDIPAPQQVEDMLAANVGVTLQLMAASTNTDIDWIKALPQAEGHHLMQAWWGVVGPFFMRCVIEEIKRKNLLVALRKRAAGQTASPGSSELGTGPMKSATTH